jgi:mono/diheme cytochrome c family protein
VSAALTDTGGTVAGTVVLANDDPSLSGAYLVQGTLRGKRLRLTGNSPSGARMVLRGTLTTSGVAGNARIRLGTIRAKGRITLALQTVTGDGSACDAVFTQNQQFFTTQVMDQVLTPLCSACHTQGGQAQATRLRVVRGDPAATARSTTLVINRTDPTASLLLTKPLGTAPHGGGQRLTAGSADTQALTQWVDLVAQAGCSPTTSGGGTGADLYAAQCAGCHGTDAAGAAGTTDLRCTVRSLLTDAVRHGRGSGTSAMPAFTTADLPDPQLGLITTYLHGLCSGSGADIYASNCASCHGTTAGGGVNADGVPGPNIRCGEAGSLGEALRGGAEGMPAFPSFTRAQVTALSGYLRSLCGLGGGGGD